MAVGSNISTVNGQQVTLEAAPVVENDRILLPIRFISETLDCKVEWDKKNHEYFFVVYLNLGTSKI